MLLFPFWPLLSSLSIDEPHKCFHLDAYLFTLIFHFLQYLSLIVKLDLAVDHVTNHTYSTSSRFFSFYLFFLNYHLSLITMSTPLPVPKIKLMSTMGKNPRMAEILYLRDLNKPLFFPLRLPFSSSFSYHISY